jgi:dynein heavy chain
LKDKIRQELFLIGLWRHESERVFEDKLINYADKKVFHDIMDRVTKEKFRDSLGFDDDQLMTNMLFADFQREDVYNEYGELIQEAPFVYEAVPDIEAIRKRINKRMDDYNEKYPSKKMNLVIFDDALKHLLRITRIINSPRGNCLLVGVGGSGK